MERVFFFERFHHRRLDRRFDRAPQLPSARVDRRLGEFQAEPFGEKCANAPKP
jgi:hypothetical protein